MNRRESGSTPANRTGHTGPVIGDGENGATRYEDDSVPGLVKKLAHELSTLFNQELALAKAEIRSNVKDIGSGASSIATGGAVLYAGLLFLLGSVMLLLTNWMDLTAAAFVVGAVVTIIGAILLSAGKKKMSADSLTPDRTIDSVKKDADLARRKIK
jgi:hypothetical protein